VAVIVAPVARLFGERPAEAARVLSAAVSVLAGATLAIVGRHAGCVVWTRGTRSAAVDVDLAAVFPAVVTAPAGHVRVAAHRAAVGPRRARLRVSARRTVWTAAVDVALPLVLDHVRARRAGAKAEVAERRDAVRVLVTGLGDR